MKNFKTIYFQPPGIKPESVEVGTILPSDPDYIYYVNEPCKVLIDDVKVIPEDMVEYDKKLKGYVIKK